MGDKVKIRPLGNRVLVEITKSEERSKGGIFLPETGKEEKSEGKVTAVGRGTLLEEGDYLPVEVKIGQTVIFGKYSGDDLMIEGVKHKILSESDILAVYGGK